MALTDQERDALADRNTDKLNDAPRPAHRLHVSLSMKNGLDYSLTCLGDEDSPCHLWEDEEANPETFRGHRECAAVEWWHYDTQSSVEGYVGADRDSLITGEVELLMWGEDGIEWQYLSEPFGSPVS